jgi:arylsulfatase A-like enzyme
MPGTTTPATRVEVPVSHMDIYPTVLELLGLERPPELQGRSLVPLMHNPALLSDNFPVMCDGEGWHTVRTRRWRYIRYSDGNEELYDHSRDPQEWYNLLHPLKRPGFTTART